MSTFLRGLGTVPGPRRATTRGRPFFATFVLSLLFVSAFACSNKQSPTPAGATVSHVHALATNPSDGSLLAATHRGVFRIEDGKGTLVGNGRQDTMGFAVRGPDSFYASGHPEPGADSFGHLGLIATDDGAKTWTTLSLEGQADFHSLAPTKSGLYGYNSLSSTLMHSSDGKAWTELFQGAITDLAADPNDPDHLLLTTETGVQDYQRGSRPTPIAGTSGIALAEWADRRTVVGLSVNGNVLVSTDTGRNWSSAGHVEGGIEALGTSAKGWQVATAKGIFESTDKGITWHRILNHP